MSKVNNLELWDSVEKTNPKYTKKANVKGNRITSIGSQYQIKNVTEQFGVYGVEWGFKELDFNYQLVDSLGLVVLNATFFFPKGSFPIKNSISVWRDNAKTKIDDDFAKKLETDTLTKAISKLGFNADIFMGLFDDLRYVEEMEKEFNKPTEAQIKAEKEAKEAKEKQIEDSLKMNAAEFADCKTMQDGKTLYDSIVKQYQKDGLWNEQSKAGLLKIKDDFKAVIDKFNQSVYSKVEEQKKLMPNQ